MGLLLEDHINKLCEMIFGVGDDFAAASCFLRTHFSKRSAPRSLQGER